MRLLKPKDNKEKFTTIEMIKGILEKDASTLNDSLNDVCYSEISSKVYREVLKRHKLWNITKCTDPLLQQFVRFIQKTLDFLSVRENQELFRHINEFYSVI